MKKVVDFCFCSVYYKQVGWRKQKSTKNYGIIAQLGEHLPYKQGVTGSSPVGPIQIWRDSLVG